MLDSIYFYCIYDLYSSLNIQVVRSSRTMKWPGNLARMGKKRNAYRVEVGKQKEKYNFLKREGVGKVLDSSGS